MGFGFVVERFGLFLRMVTQPPLSASQRGFSLWLGVALLLLGAAVAGLSRMLASTVSGAIFFQDAGFSYGFANPWVYSLIYNGLTIGVDTLLCVAVAALPPVKRLFDRTFRVN